MLELDHASGDRPGACPKCGKANAADLDHCPHCGIIFERYRQAQARQALRRRAGPRKTIAPLGLRRMGAYAKFFGQLGRMLDAGLSLDQALSQLQVGSAPTGPLARRALQRLDRGANLVEAFALAGAALPSYAWGHLEAGQTAGELPAMLRALADEIDARRRRILGQIFNWRMLWFFAILGFAAFSLAVSSSVKDLSDEAAMTSVGAVLADLAVGFAPMFILYLLLFGGVCFAFGWFQIKGKHQLTERAPGFEAFRLRIPLLSEITVRDALARYFELLSKLLQCGLPLYRSLELAQADIELPRWREEFGAVRQSVERGEGLAEGFARVPRVPADFLAELRVGERTGETAASLTRYAALLRDQNGRARMALNGAIAAALFALGALIAALVAFQGLAAIVSAYDRI